MTTDTTPSVPAGEYPPLEPSSISTRSRILLLNVLWHQGGSSPAGQPIRRMLGIGQHDRLTEQQVEAAKQVEQALDADRAARAVADDPQAAILADSSYINGLRHGYMLGQGGNEEEFQRVVTNTRALINEARADLRAAAPQGDGGAELEIIARRLAEKFASWSGWDSDARCSGPNGNEPHEERDYWRDVVRFVLAAQGQEAEPVAWLHDDPARIDVIHAKVKAVLVGARDNAGYLLRPQPDKSEHYSIPLYTHPPRARGQEAEPAQWISDPHDIEQGQMLNPEWLKLHGLTAASFNAAGHQPRAQADAERLEFVLRSMPGDALRYALGELADTADISEFRAAIDAALSRKEGGEHV